MKKAIEGNLRQFRAIENVGQGFLQEPMVLSEPEVSLAYSEVN
ncbi:MAG: hypothetical protein ABIL22_08655 [candidate division WOR-3 bacterium]